MAGDGREFVDANILVYAFDVQGDDALSTRVADRIATRLALSLDPSKFLDDGARKFTATDYVLIARADTGVRLYAELLADLEGALRQVGRTPHLARGAAR